jgi:hydroxymethylbilane synthase
LRLAAERSFLLRLDGSCQTPIAGLAVIEGDELWLRGEILRPDGSESVAGERRGPVGEGAEIGRALAEELLERAGPGFFG